MGIRCKPGDDIAETELVFRFIVLGNKMMNNLIMQRTFGSTHFNSWLFDMKRESISLYWRTIDGQYFVQQGDFRDFIENAPNKNSRRGKLNISSYDGFIFTSKSLKDTELLLQQSNREELFATVMRRTPIIILVFDEQELDATHEYYSLLSKYCETEEENISIYYIDKLFSQSRILQTILKDRLLQSARTQHNHRSELSKYSICAICYDNQRPLSIYDNFMICNSCDPDNYNEDKLIAWLRLDK